MIRFKPIAVLIAALAIIAVKPACAEDNYPTRPIRLIVGFAAGSSGDVDRAHRRATSSAS